MKLLLCWLFSLALSANPLLDLEKGIQDFVLETKRIHIPLYPAAFNPGIIRWQNSLLLSFRILPDPNDSYISQLGLVWLDNDFNPIGEPQLLNLREIACESSCRAEDARLIEVGHQLYIVYSDNVEPTISKGGFRLFVAELCFENNLLSIKTPLCLSPFEGESKEVREKNWVPFEYLGEPVAKPHDSEKSMILTPPCHGCDEGILDRVDESPPWQGTAKGRFYALKSFATGSGTLFFAYSLCPHKIFLPNLQTGECETLAETEGNIYWSWGDLRGGTPALNIGDEYLAFFHSSKKMQTANSNEKKMIHYVMGAYTFSLQYPFSIVKISQDPIIGENFYRGPTYPTSKNWSSMRGIFPGGFVMDEQAIWVVYGRQDHELGVVKLDRQKLLESLIPVSPLQSSDYQRD